MEPEPCDIPSDAVVETMLAAVLPDVCKASEYIHVRSLVLFDGETAGGARVGELTGGGDFHGVLANNSDIALGMEKGEELETVNLFIEDSKTGFSRDITYMGTTKGRLALPCAKNLRRLWEVSGFKVAESTEDGLRVLRPNFWVLSVRLLGMTPTQHRRLVKLLENCDDKFIKNNRSWLLTYANERHDAKTYSEEMRYFNLAGGEKDGPWLKEAMTWLEAHGFQQFGEQVPGPLLLATARGNPRKLTLMPLSPGSTYAHVPKALTKAWEINVKNGVVDTELSLLGDKPQFGNHGNRRHADKKATDTMDVTKCTMGDLDDHFGWDQAARRKRSQLHYKGRTERHKRARVTMML